MGQLSVDEIKEITGSIERRPKETLGDPDEGLEIRANVRDRLLRQKKAVANGERSEELRLESRQAKDDIPEDIIHLPERDPNSIAHIPSARLVHPEQAKDFELQVIEDDSVK